MHIPTSTQHPGERLTIAGIPIVLTREKNDTLITATTGDEKSVYSLLSTIGMYLMRVGGHNNLVQGNTIHIPDRNSRGSGEFVVINESIVREVCEWLSQKLPDPKSIDMFRHYMMAEGVMLEVTRNPPPSFSAAILALGNARSPAREEVTNTIAVIMQHMSAEHPWVPMNKHMHVLAGLLAGARVKNAPYDETAISYFTGNAYEGPVLTAKQLGELAAAIKTVKTTSIVR